MEPSPPPGAVAKIEYPDDNSSVKSKCEIRPSLIGPSLLILVHLPEPPVYIFCEANAKIELPSDGSDRLEFYAIEAYCGPGGHFPRVFVRNRKDKKIYINRKPIDHPWMLRPRDEISLSSDPNDAPFKFFPLSQYEDTQPLSNIQVQETWVKGNPRLRSFRTRLTLSL